MLVPAEWHQIPSGGQIQHCQLRRCVHKQLLSGRGRAALEQTVDAHQFWPEILS